MSDDEKLAQDVPVLAAMAAEMASYLDSDVLFWPLPGPRMPRLTLGGYLMRQQRLLVLKDLLAADKQNEVDTAVFQFNQALINRIVRFEQKSQHEIEARLRQWRAYLNDLVRGTAVSKSLYATAVEPRVMIAVLIDELSLAPYKLDSGTERQVNIADTQFRHHWVPGEFVWPDSWQPAYPEVGYWFLYGLPRSKENNKWWKISGEQ